MMIKYLIKTVVEETLGEITSFYVGVIFPQCCEHRKLQWFRFAIGLLTSS